MSRRTSTVLLVAASAAAALLSRIGPAADPKAEAESLRLSVKLGSPYNSGFQVVLPVAVGRPFKVVAENGWVKNSISGTLGKPVDGVYPLPLSVTEASADGKSSIGDESEYRLKLDEPQSGGPVSGVVYMRTVELTRAPE